MYYTNLILQPSSGYFLRYIIIEVRASEVQDSNSVVINKLRPLCDHQHSLSSQCQECHTLCISINMEDRPLLLPHLSFKILLQSRPTCYAIASKLRKFTWFFRGFRIFLHEERVFWRGRRQGGEGAPGLQNGESSSEIEVGAEGGRKGCTICLLTVAQLIFLYNMTWLLVVTLSNMSCP